MVAQIESLGLMGIDAYPVTVEVDFHRGLPVFEVVGLPDAAVREARDRVKAAMSNCGLNLPSGRIVANLAPADVRKLGTLYDLPILIGLLQATEQLPADCSGSAFFGELSLSGEVRPQNGALSMVLEARRLGCKNVYLPAGNAAEGALVDGINVYPVENVPQLLRHLTGQEMIAPARRSPSDTADAGDAPDFRDVRGQAFARRAAEIAAAGGHNLLLIGPPGSGKSMIASRLPSILPPMSFDEAIEVTRIYSASGMLPAGTPLMQHRPFRAPHHTISAAGLAGGGSIPHPGELTLAHHGVLFLDELPEFPRTALEALRQPLESREVIISRASARLRFPADVMFVAAMNPCPCGWRGHPTRQCTCSPARITSYAGRVSGPLLDRIDLHCEVMPVEFSDLTGDAKGESSAVMRERVLRARARQLERLPETGASCNARLSPSALAECCRMTDGASRLLRTAFDSMGLSARAYDRILKVSRTIADLAGSDIIDREHLAEAVQYRSLDRKYWNA